MLQKNIKNRTIFCKDNLDLLRGMNTETIDLVYLDPPFPEPLIISKRH